MLKLEITITDEQLADIDHVAIEGAEVWVRHAFNHFVKKIITDKAAKYHEDCVACKTRDGVNYKTAAQRNTEEKAKRDTAAAEKAAAVAAAKQTKIDALVKSGMTVEQATILIGVV